MKIRPLHDRVVVRRKDEETTTASGIVLPGSAAEKPSQGEVVAVGTGRIMDNGDVRPLALKEGDIVAYNISYIDPIGDIQEQRIDSNELVWMANLYEGEYTFALKAIDNNGLESEFSQALQCSINAQGSSCS